MLRLIDSGTIGQCAVAKFKTIGNSSVWIHEGPIRSYRALILKDINDHDRLRSFAWILDAKKVRACLQKYHSDKTDLLPSNTVLELTAI